MLGKLFGKKEKKIDKIEDEKNQQKKHNFFYFYLTMILFFNISANLISYIYLVC